MKKTLPLHLKKLAQNLNAGKDLSGKPLSRDKRQILGKLIGAKYMRSKTGKIKLIKKR